MPENLQPGPINFVPPAMPQIATPQVSVSDMQGSAVDAGNLDANAAAFLASELGPIPGVNTAGLFGPQSGIQEPGPIAPSLYPQQGAPAAPGFPQQGPAAPIAPVAPGVPGFPAAPAPEVQGAPAPQQVVLRPGEQLMQMPGGQYLVVDAMGTPQQPQYAQQAPQAPLATPGMVPGAQSGQAEVPQWEIQLGVDGQPVMGEDGKPVVVKSGEAEAGSPDNMEKFQESMTKLMSGLGSRREHELVLQKHYQDSLKENKGVRDKALSKFQDIATVSDMAPADFAGLIATVTDQAASSSYAREANDTRINDLAGYCAEKLSVFAQEHNISDKDLNEVLEAGGGLGQSVDPVRVTHLMTLALAGQASLNGVRLSASKAALAASVKAKQLASIQSPVAGGAMRIGDGQAGMSFDGRTIPQNEVDQYRMAGMYGQGGGGVPNVTDLFVPMIS